MKSKEDIKRIRRIVRVPKEEELIEDSYIHDHLPDNFYEQIFLLEEEINVKGNISSESIKKLISLYIEGINIYQGRAEVFKMKSFEYKLKKLLGNEDIGKILYQLEKNNFDQPKPSPDNKFFSSNVELINSIKKLLKDDKPTIKESAKNLAHKIKENYWNEITKYTSANEILESEIKKQKKQTEELFQQAKEKQRENEENKTVSEVIQDDNSEEDVIKKKTKYKNKLHEFMPKFKEKINEYVLKFNERFFNESVINSVDVLDDAIKLKFKEREDIIIYYDNLMRDLELAATENDDVDKVKEMMDEEKDLQLFNIEDEFNKTKIKEISKMKDYGIKKSSPLYLLNDQLKCEIFDELLNLDKDAK